MTKRRGACWILFAVALSAPIVFSQARADEVREGLLKLGDSSPLVFGGLGRDPALRAEIASRWDGLDPERRGEIAARLEAIGGWQAAPDALAAALGPDLIGQLRSRGEQAARAEQARQRLLLALTSISLLPEEELSAQGIDRGTLASALAELAQGGGTSVDPGATERLYAATFGTLDAPLQQALSGLLQEGMPPRAELESFRARMLRLLATLEGLGAERTGVQPAAAREQRSLIEKMSPSAVALIAARTDSSELALLERATAWWSGQAQPSAEQRARLERVRGVVAWLLTSQPQGEWRQALEQRLAAADAGTLLILEGHLSAIADPEALALIAESATSGAAASESGDSGMRTMGLDAEIGGGDSRLPSPPLPKGCGITDPKACIEALVSRAAGAVSDLFNAVGAPVRNWAASVRDFSFGVYQTVSSTIEQLPEQVREGIVSLTRQLLDPIRQQFTPERLAETLQLTEGFWEDLPQAPEIPCPAIGEEIPLFGTVGDGETAQKYANYLWVFEQVLDIIPDTEVSLTVEVPAKIAYGGVQYLGRCLEQAAAAVEGEQTEAYRAGVTDGLASEQERIEAGSVAVGNSRIQTAQIAGQVASWVEQSTSLIAQLNIEKTLIRPGRGGVSHFQLPERLGGQLETVRALVGATIEAVIQAGLETNGAEQPLEKGDLLYERGEYRPAFAAWREAYRRAASEVSIGDHQLPGATGKGGVR